jgi:integrase/recombinase XerD
LTPLIDRYLEHLGVTNYSPMTIRTAQSQLDLFAVWCSERGADYVPDLSRELVERYQRFIYHYRQDNGRPLAFGTQRGRLSRIKAFCAWLTKQRYLLYNPASELDLPREQVRLPVDVFSIEEVEQILSTPEVDTTLGLRDRAILELLYSTGIRRGEIADLTIYDLDFERGWLTIRHGKGDKDRVVPVGERALAWVFRYLEDSRSRLVLHLDEPTLFIGKDGLPMTRNGLGNRVGKILARSGVRQRAGCCHLFRHTMATKMLEAGADIRFIQQMLGHARLDTTQVYTKVSIHHLKRVHDATHPAAKLERTNLNVDDSED